jgi:hypothetical protein
MTDGLFIQAREIEHREGWYILYSQCYTHWHAGKASKRPVASILHSRSMDNGLSSTL